jgi:hypothetical protein
MRVGGAAAEPVADDPRLHDDPAMSPAGAPLPRFPLQPIGGGLAAPDPRAPSLAGRAAAAPATAGRDRVSGPPFAFAACRAGGTMCAMTTTRRPGDCIERRSAARRPRPKVGRPLARMASRGAHHLADDLRRPASRLLWPMQPGRTRRS